MTPRAGHHHREAVRASAEALATIDERRPIDAQRFAATIASQIHELTGALAVVYRPARAVDEWLVASHGPRSSIMSENLARCAMSSSDWFLYDPLRPSPAQRNVVQVTENSALPAASAAFFTRLQPGFGQTRLLVCDGPVLLAWIGIVRAPERRHDHDRRALRQIGRGIRRRLRLSLGIQRSLALASFEASLEAFPGEAYLVRADGRIEHANAQGAECLVREPHAIERQLREAVRANERQADGFELQRLRSASMPGHFLATRRAACGDLGARLRRAQHRWCLSPRQMDVLARLAVGDSNKEVAARLQMSLRTVEQHVAAILGRAKVESRLRLVAKLWSA